MNRMYRIVVTGVLAAGVNSCAGLPAYVPDSGAELSAVRLSPNMASDSLGMCTERGAYTLVPKDGVVYVPDNTRVRIWRAYVTSGYHVTYSCAPGISFTPRPGVAYYADFEVRAEHCSLLVYRRAPASRAGVALDPTIGRDMCPAAHG